MFVHVNNVPKAIFPYYPWPGLGAKSSLWTHIQHNYELYITNTAPTIGICYEDGCHGNIEINITSGGAQL